MNRWFRLFAVALALALIATACGGDDEDNDASETPEEETTTEVAEVDSSFCDAIIEAEAAVIAASQGDPTADPTAALDEAEANAPEEISAEVSTLVEGSRTALEEQDDSIFEDPEFSAADETVDQYVIDSCEVESFDVAAVEYAFEGLPETVPAGNVGLTLTNEGEELHEMILVRFKDPEANIEELIELPQKEAEKQIENVGFSFANPGESDAQTFQLDAGTYGVVCFVSTGTTPDKEGDGPPHAFQGMAAQFTVE
jgi:uncharacterized cupredoxin-like copper-binding protein